jgi:hypothetical protein
MTSTEPTKPKRRGPERGGKPDYWTPALWNAYKNYGKSDAMYVASCDRFLAQMLKRRLDETLELTMNLRDLAEQRGEAPLHDPYEGGIQSVPALLINSFLDKRWQLEGEAHDYLDCYREWYKKHIRWPKECYCERIPPLIADKGAWRTEPMFLTACLQLALRSLSGEFGPLVVDGAEDELRVYLTRGVWRLDQGAMDKVFLMAERKPEEDRRAYIGRVKDELDDKLIAAMHEATEIASRRRVEVQKGSSEIDPELQHETMLTMRLFGATRKKIAQDLPDTLEGVKWIEAEVHRRTKQVAEYLGFLPPAGDDTT